MTQIYGTKTGLEQIAETRTPHTAADVAQRGYVGWVMLWSTRAFAMAYLAPDGRPDAKGPVAGSHHLVARAQRQGYAPYHE